MKKPILRNVLIIIFSILIILCVGAVLFYNVMLKPTSQSSSPVALTIKDGSTAKQIGKTLKENGLIKDENVFFIYVRWNKINNMKSGEYNLDKNMGVEQIVKELQSGTKKNSNAINITFKEGKNMRWIAKQIATYTNNSEESVYDTMKDSNYLDSLIQKYWFLTDDIKNANIYYPLEGYLFPDTYNFMSKNVKVTEIFGQMLDQMEKKLASYKTEIQSSQISVHKLLTVASIAECEASNSQDRKNVASVIYNRLQNNMPLGSDVTTYYAIKVDMNERDLKKSELNKYNPYNTRGPNMQGKLPIGPICSPSLEAIEAALHPAKTNYLYFVADKNGKVYFATTEAEQNQNIKQLQSQGLWYSYQ